MGLSVCGQKVDFEKHDELQADAVHGLAVEIVEQPAKSLKELLPQISRDQQRMATRFRQVHRYIGRLALGLARAHHSGCL